VHKGHIKRIVMHRIISAHTKKIGNCNDVSHSGLKMTFNELSQRMMTEQVEKSLYNLAILPAGAI
jgi:hypothetical protein